MRILTFGWEFPPYISGGLGTACFGITKGLTDLGQEVIFVLPRVQGEIKDAHVKLLSAAHFVQPLGGEQGAIKSAADKLRMKTVDSPLRPYMDEKQYAVWRENFAGKGSPTSLLASGMSADYGADLLQETCRYGRAADKIAQEESFDIIYGHDWMSVMACVHARRISGKPYVYHAHALEFDRCGEEINQAVYDLEKYGMEVADAVIAVSHFTKETIVTRYGLDPDKITVVHNAVSRKQKVKRSACKKKGAGKIVLFLGRITFQKGPEYFVEAASLVAQNISGVRFVMAGAGDMMPAMIEKVAELRMGRYFHFTGFLRGEDVERIYNMSDLYVMPSVSEPFGISPLEAMLCDVPVIISKQSGVAEILHHALKVDFWNVRELADKIIALLRHPHLGHEICAGARDELKEISWEQAAAKILAVFRQVSINSIIKAELP